MRLNNSLMLNMNLLAGVPHFDVYFCLYDFICGLDGNSGFIRTQYNDILLVL